MRCQPFMMASRIPRGRDGNVPFEAARAAQFPGFDVHLRADFQSGSLSDGAGARRWLQGAGSEVEFEYGGMNPARRRQNVGVAGVRPAPRGRYVVTTANALDQR